jgi:hypothetical protein
MVVGMAAAAVVLLTLFAPWKRSNDDLTFWIPAGRDVVEVRSAAPSQKTALMHAIEAYDRRDLDEALRLLESLQLEGSLLHFRNIYLASALTLSEHGEAALAVLDAVPVHRLPMPWRDEAGWIRYIALVQAGRDAEGREELRRLAERSGDIGDRARARLTELE